MHLDQRSHCGQLFHFYLMLYLVVRAPWNPCSCPVSKVSEFASCDLNAPVNQRNGRHFRQPEHQELLEPLTGHVAP